MLTSRRSFITGLVSLMAAPAIVRAGSLMPVKQMLTLPEADGSFKIFGEAWIGAKRYIVDFDPDGHMAWKQMDRPVTADGRDGAPLSRIRGAWRTDGALP